MKILVDADSCPRDARELALRAARRLGIHAIFAANRPLPGITGDTVTMELCPEGENSADNRIVELAAPGDLVISRDLALVQRLLEKNVSVLDDRGRVFSPDNIKELLSLRDFTVALSYNGLGVERIAAYGKKNRKAFADSLDRLLVKLQQQTKQQLRQQPTPL